MQGTIELTQQDGVVRVTLSHPPRFNAMSRAMWRELKSIFECLQGRADVRCVLMAGEGANFCSGGDISEYADFRFEEASLRDFHENEVWGGLQAMLDCDVPIVAKIRGNCMGAGIEMASCCDIRLAAVSARFGAPIARLGFPMAPREAALVAREAGLSLARQMLLEAAVFSASDMKSSGFLSRICADEHLAGEADTAVLRIASLAPQATRLNKQVLRALASRVLASSAASAPELAALAIDQPYAYADSAEHREGILAFLEKRKPEF